MKDTKFYKYSEIRNDKTTITYGWVNADSISEDEDYILSYHSRSKFASEEEAKNSKEEGNNVATFSDYVKFFNAQTGVSPETFYNKWKDDEEGLKLFLKCSNKEHLFLLKLARLLLTGNKFVMYSRGYKLVKKSD